MLGLRVRVESTALERYEAQIEADRHDAARLVADEERRAEIARQIQAAGVRAPHFAVRGSRFHYQEPRAADDLRERKSIAKERCSTLQALCANRSNAHPMLVQLVDRYAKALRNLRKDRGGYRLFLSGLDLEGYVRVTTAAPPDVERNPPLDGDLIHAVEALIIAQAGLMALLPDIRRVSAELDSYRENAQAIDVLRSRIFDPALVRLANSANLLDEDAAAITAEIVQLGKANAASVMLKGEQAVKHSWLRGVLTAFGQRVVAQTRQVVAKGRSVLIRKGLEATWRHSDALTGAVVHFLESARTELLTLAEKLPVSFGWLKALYDLIFPA